MAYKGCTTRLVINNNVSKKIPVLSSVRQGSPLSPLLFALYLKPFCLSVIANRNIPGFLLNSVEVKVSAYADDVAVFCSDEECVMEMVMLTKEFCNATGAAVNWGKCCGVWHGRWDLKPRYFAGINWEEGPCKYLGVPLEYYKGTTGYWTGVAKDLKVKADTWVNRNLSIFARATVCNIFLIAKLWYIMQVLTCYKMNIQKFHRVFATFIWKSEASSQAVLASRIFSSGSSCRASSSCAIRTIHFAHHNPDETGELPDYNVGYKQMYRTRWSFRVFKRGPRCCIIFTSPVFHGIPW